MSETPTVTAAPVVDCADTTALMKFALQKIAEVELQADVSIDDKIKQVTEYIKAEIRKSDLPPAVRVAAMDWCDDALPHVIKAVDFVKDEIKKAAVAEVAKVEAVVLQEIAKVEAVVLVDVKKCCPSFFTSKTPAKVA